MTRWLIEEKCTYIVEARTRDDAERVFLDHGPEVSPTGKVQMGDVVERTIEEAD